MTPEEEIEFIKLWYRKVGTKLNDPKSSMIGTLVEWIEILEKRLEENNVRK